MVCEGDSLRKKEEDEPEGGQGGGLLKVRSHLRCAGKMNKEMCKIGWVDFLSERLNCRCVSPRYLLRAKFSHSVYKQRETDGEQ